MGEIQTLFTDPVSHRQEVKRKTTFVLIIYPDGYILVELDMQVQR